MRAKDLVSPGLRALFSEPEPSSPILRARAFKPLSLNPWLQGCSNLYKTRFLFSIFRLTEKGFWQDFFLSSGLTKTKCLSRREVENLFSSYDDNNDDDDGYDDDDDDDDNDDNHDNDDHDDNYGEGDDQIESD